MPNVAVGQYLETKVYTFCDNQLGINVHYSQITAVGGAPVTGMVAAQQLSTIYAPLLKALMTSEALYLGVSLRQWSVGDPNYVPSWSKVGAGPGLGGATPCPKQVSGLFGKLTAIGGPGGRGRTYIPFPATDAVEPDGNPTVAYRVAAQSYAIAATGLLVVSADFTINNGLFRWRTPLSFKQTVGYGNPDKFATQRRRGDYGRLNVIPSNLV